MQALVSVMALAIAGMVLRSEPNLQAQRFARVMERIAVVRPEFPKTHDSERRGVIMRGLMEGLGTTLGEVNVAATSREPRSGPPGDQLSVDVSPTYFEILDLPLIAGRAFTKNDPAERVAVVNEGLARNLWRGQSAVGKILPTSTSSEVAREVVGVVKDSSAGDLVSYRPLAMKDAVALFVRGSNGRVKQSAIALGSTLDPETRVDVLSGTAWATRSLPISALTGRLFGEFGAFALLLATTGLFTLCQYAVQQRTRELGIRRVLGAGAVQILATVLRPALRSLASGLMAGTIAALCCGFAMRYWDLPAGVDPLDPANYLIVALTMMAATLLAIWRPSRQAIHIEPSVALRYE
jgi:ABC-type antimicrobial peptide transport system permease subunit